MVRAGGQEQRITAAPPSPLAPRALSSHSSIRRTYPTHLHTGTPTDKSKDTPTHSPNPPPSSPLPPTPQVRRLSFSHSKGPLSPPADRARRASRGVGKTGQEGRPTRGVNKENVSSAIA